MGGRNQGNKKNEETLSSNLCHFTSRTNAYTIQKLKILSSVKTFQGLHRADGTKLGVYLLEVFVHTKTAAMYLKCV